MSEINSHPWRHRVTAKRTAKPVITIATKISNSDIVSPFHSVVISPNPFRHAQDPFQLADGKRYCSGFLLCVDNLDAALSSTKGDIVTELSKMPQFRPMADTSHPLTFPFFRDLFVVLAHTAILMGEGAHAKPADLR